jgi:hypothetical protein
MISWWSGLVPKQLTLNEFRDSTEAGEVEVAAESGDMD